MVLSKYESFISVSVHLKTKLPNPKMEPIPYEKCIVKKTKGSINVDFQLLKFLINLLIDANAVRDIYESNNI